MVYLNDGISLIKLMAKFTVTSSGTIAFTYNPSTMSLDPVLELLSPTSTSTPPPPPVKPISKPFDYTKFIVISAGILVIVALVYYYEKSKKGGSGGYGGRRI